MPVQDVAALVDALAAAIDHAANRGVHHGLLHLRDIVLSADAVRITGFGIAGALTAIGAKLPTRPQYSSPSVASDVYSLGAIAFEAATGRPASPDSLNELEAQLGTKLRDAFDLALNADPSMRQARAQDFADRLRRATGATNAMGAKDEPAAPIAPIAPVAAVAPPVAPDDPLDRVIDLGEPRDLEVDPPAVTANEERQSPPRALNRPWSTQPSEELDPTDRNEPEPARRKWPIAVAAVTVAIIAALSVGWFLRWRAAGSVLETPAGIDATIVDLPGSSPAAPGVSARKPAPTAPIAPGTRAPAPTPSRPASGAVERAATGSMLIRSTPADADVLVDGKPRGKTPVVLRELALGSYTIRVARDGYAAEERTLQLTRQRPTSSMTLTLRPEKTGPGGLNVQSRPPGARVFVNDRLAGSTPIAIPGLPAGSTTVRIELEGYEPWTTTVRVGAGEQTRVAASLDRK
jgi:hypothetical protein